MKRNNGKLAILLILVSLAATSLDKTHCLRIESKPDCLDKVYAGDTVSVTPQETGGDIDLSDPDCPGNNNWEEEVE